METACRYFAASALAGRLFVDGIAERGPWNLRLLTYRTEAEIGYIFKARTGDRRAKTVAELREILEESRRRGLPMLRVWVAEGLEGEARKAWEGS